MDSNVSQLLLRIDNVEKRVSELEKKYVKNKDDAVTKVKKDLLARSVYNSRFFYVPPNYYDLTLEERAALLGGNTPQLCKSIIFENLACDHNSCEDPTNSRYYCVIIQYIGESF